LTTRLHGRTFAEFSPAPSQRSISLPAGFLGVGDMPHAGAMLSVDAERVKPAWPRRAAHLGSFVPGRGRPRPPTPPPPRSSGAKLLDTRVLPGLPRPHAHRLRTRCPPGHAPGGRQAAEMPLRPG